MYHISKLDNVTLNGTVQTLVGYFHTFMKTLTERLRYTNPRKKELKNGMLVYLFTKIE
jgi:hypothetical protein